MKCLYNGRPTANCSIRCGNDPTYSNLTNTDSAMAGGFINLTSTLTGEITYYIVSTTTESLVMELCGAFNTCTCSTEDLMVFNVTVRPQSSCEEPTGDIPLACYNGVTPGSIVMYYCVNSSTQSNRTCQTDGSWSGHTLSCDRNSELSLTLYCSNYIVHYLAKILTDWQICNFSGWPTNHFQKNLYKSWTGSYSVRRLREISLDLGNLIIV